MGKVDYCIPQQSRILSIDESDEIMIQKRRTNEQSFEIKEAGSESEPGLVPEAHSHQCLQVPQPLRLSHLQSQ